MNMQEKSLKGILILWVIYKLCSEILEESEGIKLKWLYRYSLSEAAEDSI